MTGSLRAYAKHRKERGLRGGTLAAVQKALATQRITKGSDGSIDFERADREWEENLNHRKLPAGRTWSGDAGEASPLDPGNSIHPETFLEAQRQHEWLKVQKEELALRVRRGELLERTEQEKEYGTLLTTFRGRLLLLPDKLAPRVAVIGDVLECRALIEREVREAMSALTEYQTHAA